VKSKKGCEVSTSTGELDSLPSGTIGYRDGGKSEADMNSAKCAYRRGENPNSLKNLKPAKPGQIRNSTGKNRNRPYTDAYEGLADAPLPEFLRLQLNNQARVDARKKKLPDLYPKGITWAEASALRQHLNAVVNGDTRSATEVREAVEGRATQRIELSKRNSKLEELLDAARAHRESLKKPDNDEPK